MIGAAEECVAKGDDGVSRESEGIEAEGLLWAAGAPETWEELVAEGRVLEAVGGR